MFQTAKTLHQAGYLPASHERFSPPPRPARKISRQKRRASLRAERKLVGRSTFSCRDCSSSTGLVKDSLTTWISAGPQFIRETWVSFIDTFISAFTTGPLIYEAAAAPGQGRRGNAYRLTPYDKSSGKPGRASNGSQDHGDMYEKDDYGDDDGASPWPLNARSPVAGGGGFSCPVGNRSKKDDDNNPCRNVTLNSPEDVIIHCRSKHFGCPICVKKDQIEVKKAFFGTVKDLKNHIIRMHFHHLRCPINNCDTFQSLKNGFKRHAQKSIDHGNNRLSDTQFEAAWTTMTNNFREQHPKVSQLVEDINRVSPKPAREALITLEKLLYRNGLKVYDSSDKTNLLDGPSIGAATVTSESHRGHVFGNDGPLQIDQTSTPMDHHLGQSSLDYNMKKFFPDLANSLCDSHQPTMTSDGSGFLPTPHTIATAQNNIEFSFGDFLNDSNWASPTSSQINSMPSMPTVANGGILITSHDNQPAFYAHNPSQNRHHPSEEPYMGLEPQTNVPVQGNRPTMAGTRQQSVPVLPSQGINVCPNKQHLTFPMDHIQGNQRPTVYHSSTAPAAPGHIGLIPAPTTLAPSHAPGPQAGSPFVPQAPLNTGTADMEEFLHHWDRITPLLQRADTATRRTMEDVIDNTLSGNPPPETAHSDTTYGGSSQTPSETVRSENLQQQQQLQQQATVGMTGSAFLSTSTTFEDSFGEPYGGNYQYNGPAMR